jgi:hypothetical protein
MSLSLGLVRWSLAAVVAVVAVSMLLVGVWVPVPVAGAVGVCPNEEFRTGPSAALPDCRAYEMVSPPNKNGGEVDGGVRFGETIVPEQAAADGEAVTYGSSSAFLETGSRSALVSSQYLSRRTAAGWSTQAISPEQENPEGLFRPALGQPDWSLFQGFNEELTSAFLLAWNPQPVASAPQGYFNPYLRDDDSGTYQLLSSVTPKVWAPGETELWGEGFGAVYAGMSADGQHVIFEANEALTPGAVSGRDNLYEWNAGQPLELVSVLPDGKADTEGEEFPLAGQGESGLRFGTAELRGLGADPAQESYNYSGALSSDGMRAFWSGGEKIYMHEITGSGAARTVRTVEVSASQKGAGGSGSGTYWTANPSGSLVYFTSTEQLTDDSTATPGAADLYQYDVQTGVLSDLTVDRNGSEAAGVQGVLGSGESDGVPYVYSIANGVLGDGAKEGATPGNCKHVNAVDEKGTGACNLYVWHGGETRFIARLGTAEAEARDFAEAVMIRTSRVSPNGKLLAFQSERPLTGYDNLPASGECPLTPAESGAGGGERYQNSEGRCVEVFEYDAQSGRLVCASCDPSGRPPTGESIIPEVPHLLESVYGWESSTVQQRYLLDDGVLFFDSEDALLPQATDGKQSV